MVNLLYMDLQKTLNRVWSWGIVLLYWFRTERACHHLQWLAQHGTLFPLSWCFAEMWTSFPLPNITGRSMGLLEELRSNWWQGKTWQTWMSASHKLILRSEISESCCFDSSKGSPTLWDGQPHVCLLLCGIDRGQKHYWWGWYATHAMGAEGDNFLIHFKVLAFTNDFGTGEHLECRFSSLEFVQFVGGFIVVTFESPCVLDHSCIGFELLFGFPFITYDPIRSQGQSSQSCGTKFCRLGVLWIRINVSTPSHCQ